MKIVLQCREGARCAYNGAVFEFEPFGNMLLINGNPQPRVFPLKTGVKYRFRLTNITPNAANLRVALKQLSGAPAKWRILAKDGADLPATAAITKTADQFITVGETYDFEYQADQPQELALEIYNPIALKQRAVQSIVFSALESPRGIASSAP